ncbi:MAG TPA: hypothetical protein ACFE0H_05740 [Elainellaceae cyanobacterium]
MAIKSIQAVSIDKTNARSPAQHLMGVDKDCPVNENHTHHLVLFEPDIRRNL